MKDSEDGQSLPVNPDGLMNGMILCVTFPVLVEIVSSRLDLPIMPAKAEQEVMARNDAKQMSTGFLPFHQTGSV